MTTTADHAWAAGFFDGEGHAKVNGNRAWLRVDSVNPRPLERLATLYGGSVCKLKKRANRPKNRQAYRWSIYAGTAIEAAGKMLNTRQVSVKEVELVAVRDHKKYPEKTEYGKTLRLRADAHREAEYK